MDCGLRTADCGLRTVDCGLRTKLFHQLQKAERLIVLRWFEVLHAGLPSNGYNVFEDDLQTKSLKGLQPRTVYQVEDFVSQIKNKSSEIDTRFTRFSEKKVRFPNNHGNRTFGSQLNQIINNPSKAWQKQFNKKCKECHCPNVRLSDRTNLIKSLNLEIDLEEEDEDEHGQYDESGFTGNIATVDIHKTSVTMILDTGATCSMISLTLCELARLQVYPATYSAI